MIVVNYVMQAPQNYTHIQRSPHMFYRNKVINQFHNQLSIVVLVTQSLTTYMARAHEYAKGISLVWILYNFTDICTVLILYMPHCFDAFCWETG